MAGKRGRKKGCTGNGLLGLKVGPNRIRGDQEEAKNLRKALESEGKFVYQDLIDGWRTAFGSDWDYQEGSHIKPINGEGEES